jgi:hypothetical protein
MGDFMPLLSPHAVEEFQAIWKKRYGVALPRDRAVIAAGCFINLVAVLSQPMDANKLKHLMNLHHAKPRLIHAHHPG